MDNKANFNQVTSKQGIICLVLLLLALLFANVSSVQMTLAMMPKASSPTDMVAMTHVDMAHDDMSQQPCHDMSSSHCQTDDDHQPQGCSQAHCSTLPVLSSPFTLVALNAPPEAHANFAPTILLGEPNTPYIPPIA